MMEPSPSLDSHPRVSVVIPAYNAERWIATAISSVLRQTWPNVECLVVNDGSTDSTPQVVDEFAGRVRFIEVPNLGVAKARNIGAENATGEFIAFLDADDAWKPAKVERQMDVFARERDLGLVYTALELIDEEGQTISRLNAPEPQEALRRTLLLEDPPVGLAQSAMMPATVLGELGGFDERLSTSADADLFCRVATRYTVAAVNDALALYRQRPGQMHHNLAALEHDMQIIYQKHFDSDRRADRNAPRRKAEASLYMTLAAAYGSEGKWRPAAHKYLRAVRTNPRRSLQLTRRLLRRRIGRLAASTALHKTTTPSERVTEAGSSPWWGEHRSRYRFAEGLVPGKRVLDVGCGSGYGAELLRDAGASQVVGIDISAAAIEQASRRSSRRLSFTLADAFDLPYDACAFDLVVSFETLEHVLDGHRFLQELRRVVSDDGIVLISTPNAYHTKPINCRPRNPYHVREYTPPELRALLQRYFSTVSLLGQRPHSRFRPCPFWERPEVLPRTVAGNARVVTWKLEARLPSRVRESISKAMHRQPFFPGEWDFVFDSAAPTEGHVVLAVCRP
jgi:glycosyltransferase involved in cell wall biosynthesis/SAM-dependent methyltransferase